MISEEMVRATLGVTELDSQVVCAPGDFVLMSQVRVGSGVTMMKQLGLRAPTTRR